MDNCVLYRLNVENVLATCPKNWVCGINSRHTLDFTKVVYNILVVLFEGSFSSVDRWYVNRVFEFDIFSGNVNI